MRFFRFIRISFVFVGFLFIALLSSGTCFGGTWSTSSDSTLEENKCTVCGYIGNFVLSTLVWRINVPITWTNYYDNSEGFRGTIFGKGWYPKNLSFKNGNFKIGFFLFEFRPVELVIAWFLALRYGLSFMLDEADGWNFIPIRFYFFHIKLWCIRMLWFNPGNILVFVRSIYKIWAQKLMSDSFSYFFVTYDFHFTKHSGYIFLLTTLIPYISIDMSWFNKNNKKEKVSWED